MYCVLCIAYLSCLVGLISSALRSPSILIVLFFLAQAVVKNPVAVDMDTQHTLLVVKVEVVEEVEM